LPKGLGNVKLNRPFMGEIIQLSKPFGKLRVKSLRLPKKGSYRLVKI
jgi:hypothetical protein